MSGLALPYQNTVAVLASMHGKERVIAPLLQELGLSVAVAPGLDTDRFGTFSREIERTLSPLEAARAKIHAAFERAPHARVGLASEGSFGPHPFIPFLPLGQELVLLIDRDAALELTGRDASPATNFGHVVAPDLSSALSFAERSGFPGHGLIVVGCRDGLPAPDLALIKDLPDRRALEAAVARVIALCGAAFVETDMRAHRNPTRMSAIGRATADLVRRYLSRCPVCAQRGFDITERLPGLPCAACGAATRLILTEVLSCTACNYREMRPAASAVADPGSCDYCNP